MSAVGGKSYNRQRKATYAAKADQSSRNQDALSGPVVGKFVKVDKTVMCRTCDGTGAVENDVGGNENCDRCQGAGRRVVRDADGSVVQTEVIVHDERNSTASSSAPSSTVVPTAISEPRVAKAGSRRRERQESAWRRCPWKSRTGAHDYSGVRHGKRSELNCITCGCPVEWTESS